MKIIDVPVEKINVGWVRHRRDMGDMEALTANIREIGLLQPIGIDEYFKLIFGERRLWACRELGWKQIPCVVLKMKSLLVGEYAENEFRKQFTVSEREAIGRAVEAERGGRHGGDRRSSSAIAAVGKGEGRAVDIAAKLAGFSSTEQYERAKVVAAKGTPELKEAVDAGEVSISAGAAIASQPKDDQQVIVTMPKDERREVLRQIRKTAADREKDERRARDIRLFRGLYNAVKFIGEFHETPVETWNGLWRVSAYDFADYMKRAQEYLLRLRKEQPNEPKQPVRVS